MHLYLFYFGVVALALWMKSSCKWNINRKILLLLFVLFCLVVERLQLLYCIAHEKISLFSFRFSILCKQNFIWIRILLHSRSHVKSMNKQLWTHVCVWVRRRDSERVRNDWDLSNTFTQLQNKKKNPRKIADVSTSTVSTGSIHIFYCCKRSHIES